MQFSLRPTVIAGDTLSNDYCVIHDGRNIGRIRLADERSGQGVVWVWNINPPLPIPSWCKGSSGSFEGVKVAFKAAWEHFYESLTPEGIESWHRTEDLANANANASWLK